MLTLRTEGVSHICWVVVIGCRCLISSFQCPFQWISIEMLSDVAPVVYWRHHICISILGNGGALPPNVLRWYYAIAAVPVKRWWVLDFFSILVFNKINTDLLSMTGKVRCE